MLAANIEALNSPNANSALAYLPASGRSASAASWAVSMCPPALWIVAPQASTMKNATTSVTMQPTTTSSRESGYSSMRTPFSTIADCR